MCYLKKKKFESEIKKKKKPYTSYYYYTLNVGINWITSPSIVLALFENDCRRVNE